MTRGPYIRKRDPKFQPNSVPVSYSVCLLIKSMNKNIVRVVYIDRARLHRFDTTNINGVQRVSPPDLVVSIVHVLFMVMPTLILLPQLPFTVTLLLQLFWLLLVVLCLLLPPPRLLFFAPVLSMMMLMLSVSVLFANSISAGLPWSSQKWHKKHIIYHYILLGSLYNKVQLEWTCCYHFQLTW